MSNLLYLPQFTGYSEYDFRNDQSLDMFEDVFWETTWSSYNYYDYLALAKNIKKGPSFNTKSTTLENFFSSDLTYQLKSTNFQTFNKGVVGKEMFYSNPIVFDEFVSFLPNIYSSNFNQFSYVSDISEGDEAYTYYKNLVYYNYKHTSILLGTSFNSVLSQSYLSVINNFRGDYEDFSLWVNKNINLQNKPTINLIDGTNIAPVSDIVVDSTYTPYFNPVRFSNVPVLRSSVRNSIVNYNAFQKVSRARFDESRANINSTHFAHLGQKQPFLTDSKIPYLSLLRKNNEFFYSSPLYTKNLLFSFNNFGSLLGLLNTPLYDFPFLLSHTSDVIRYSWIDWFAQ